MRVDAWFERTAALLPVSAMDPLVVSSEVVIPAGDLRWSAVRASGPGGQNVNKVATKVELCFDLIATAALSDAVKVRLRRQAARYIAADGSLVVSCQETRSQLQNLDRARGELAAIIARALVKPKRRRATRPTRASVERRLQHKRQHAERKRQRKRADRE
jgi:ribosome-associated protein